MNHALTRVVRSIALGLAPYPDLRRRRTVRAATRRLVVCRPWPADSAVTGADLAQLTLLRLLDLQKQTRRAVRGRQREAAALLARSSLEACFMGLYCLRTADAVPRLREANLKAGIKSLAFLDRDGLFPKHLMEQAAATFGNAKPGPTVKKMVEDFDAQSGGDAAAALYERLYDPTSMFFAHANAASLMRHVKADGSLTERPSMPWARRSPVRLADACVGLLAAAVASEQNVASAQFAEYGSDHGERVLTPMVVMAGKKAAGRSGILALVPVLREALQLASYLRSAQAAADPARLREQRVRAVYARLVATLFDPDLPAATIAPIVDHFVEMVLQDTEDFHSTGPAVAGTA